MSNIEKFLEMLQSEKASVRYEACEELRVATESSPEIVLALERSLNDEDADVAERARAALDAEVHQQMAIELGIIVPPKEEQQSEPQTKPQEPITLILGFEPIIYAIAGFIGGIGKFFFPVNIGIPIYLGYILFLFLLWPAVGMISAMTLRFILTQNDKDMRISKFVRILLCALFGLLVGFLSFLPYLPP